VLEGRRDAPVQLCLSVVFETTAERREVLEVGLGRFAIFFRMLHGVRIDHEVVHAPTGEILPGCGAQLIEDTLAARAATEWRPAGGTWSAIDGR